MRHVHPGGSRFEITTRALQSRYLIPTGERFRSIAVGIMARAKERYPVELYAFGGLSSHLHLLLGADDVDQLAGFMGFVNSGSLGKRIGSSDGRKNSSDTSPQKATSASVVVQSKLDFVKLRFHEQLGPPISGHRDQ